MARSKNPLAPHQLWRNRFSRVLASQSEDDFIALMDQHRQNPSLSWGTNSAYEQTPMELAVIWLSGWGVQQLLKAGHPLTEKVFGKLFREIDISKKAGDRVGIVAVQKLWPVLLPTVLSSLPLKTFVLQSYFDLLNNGRLAREVTWEALEMGRIVEGLADAPVLQHNGVPVTALQLAFLKGCPHSTECLLTAGANGRHVEPASAMPGWTLDDGMTEVTSSHVRSWDHVQLQNHLSQKWGIVSLDVLSQLQSLVLNLCHPEVEQRWQGVHTKLRIQGLSESLAQPSVPERRGPRF